MVTARRSRLFVRDGGLRGGWRIDKPNARTNIDAIIALCMAVERAENPAEPVQLLGWI
jgi:hypothetical protein